MLSEGFRRVFREVLESCFCHTYLTHRESWREWTDVLSTGGLITNSCPRISPNHKPSTIVQGIELVHLMIELLFAFCILWSEWMKDTCMNLPMVGYHLLNQPTSIWYHCFGTFWSLCNFSVFDPNGHQLSNRPSVSHQLLFTGKSLAISINLVTLPQVHNLFKQMPGSSEAEMSSYS